MKLIIFLTLGIAFSQARMVFQDEWEEWKSSYGK